MGEEDVKENEEEEKGTEERETEEEMSFAELFEAHPGTPSRGFSPGDTVSGVVAKISKETIFVDLGGKSEGIMDAEEFLDKDGHLTLREGERVELRVASIKDGIHLSKGLKVRGAEAADLLREARESRIPVEGRVTAVRKGGFEIDISGNRAFCPLSQIDLRFCEKPEEHVGQRYQFRIMEIKERGRNIVVSRRNLLQEEQEKKLKEILAMLKPGFECEGKVTKIMDFGAFVDIGGVEGMVHVSEISHTRVNHPSEILKPGQQVKVRVLKIDSDVGGRGGGRGGDRIRIALSIKALEPDSWEKGLGFEEGEIIRGKISRVADFGAFVEVAPGVDGLVHISEISYEPISHPKKVLHEGDPVEVLVMAIDREARRISLSIKEAVIKKRMTEGKERADRVSLEVGQVLRGIVEDVKPYGLFVRLPQLGTGIRGLLPSEELGDAGKGDVKKKFPKGKEIQVEILSIDEKGRIRLSQKVMEEREDREDFERFVERQKKGEKLGSLEDLLKDVKI